MNSNQSTPASAVAALQQEIRTRTEVIRTLADLREQLDADRIYDAATETLTIGCYGRFVPEDSIRRRDDDEIIAAEPFNEPAE